jgi:hypothetical protein
MSHLEHEFVVKRPVPGKVGHMADENYPWYEEDPMPSRTSPSLDEECHTDFLLETMEELGDPWE